MKSLTEAQLLKIQQDAYKLGHNHALDQVSMFEGDRDETLEFQEKQQLEATAKFIKLVSEV